MIVFNCLLVLWWLCILKRLKDVNTYDEFFAGLTNPKHETEVRNVLFTVCNGAIKTLVKTSHQVLTSSNSSKSSPSVSPSLAIEHRQATADELYEQKDALLTELKARNSFDKVKNNGWVSQVSSTLADPSYRKFVLDVTGRIKFETARFVLQILLEILYQGMKKCVKVAHEDAVEGVLEVVTSEICYCKVLSCGRHMSLCACIFLVVFAGAKLPGSRGIPGPPNFFFF